MNISLIAIGRMSRGPAFDLIEDYRRRLPWSFAVKEIDVKKPSQTTAKRKEEEAERLIAATPEGAIIIALDERGKSLSSLTFASKMETWIFDGYKHVAFIIGGADGLDETVRRRADLILGFGQMTWPHMMVRVMVTEQLYRTWSILNGHPYHRQ